MMKTKYSYYILLIICLCFCSSTDDDKQDSQPPIEIPDADELASIGVGLVAYYTFLMMRQVMTAFPIIMMQH